MEREIKDHKRKPRNRKTTILIGAEGKNKTERTYFGNFNTRDSKYIISFSNGNATDPVNIVKDTINTMKQEDIKAKNGDKIYCLIDTDDKKYKDKQIEDAIKLAKKNNIEVIISNPCFEYWFLCHFINTSKPMNNTEIINDLKKYIPNYKKNINVYPYINQYTNKAIKNSKKQIKYQQSLNKDINKLEANPCTSVHKVVENIT